MTIREMIELNKPSKIEIKCKDYRACKPVDEELLMKFYKGTDVLDEEAKKYTLTDDKTLECYL